MKHPVREFQRIRREYGAKLTGTAGPTLTLILIGLGLAAIAIAIFGSTRLKAAAAVWLSFP